MCSARVDFSSHVQVGSLKIKFNTFQKHVSDWLIKVVFMKFRYQSGFDKGFTCVNVVSAC